MKWFGYAIFLIVLGLIIYAYFYGNPKRTGNPASTATQTAAAQPPASGLAPGAAGAAPAPTPAQLSLEPRIRAVAAQTGVTIGSLQASGKAYQVQVDWIGDVASIGGDFVEQLIRQGVIRDFDGLPGGSRWYDDQGRSHFTESFLLKP